MKIRPVRTPVELEAVHNVAREDGHLLAWPSHIVEKDDYIIGSVSIMPVAFVWMHTQKAKVRDSLQVKDTIEAMLSNQARSFCMPCLESSPLIQVLRAPKMEYIELGKMNLFLKGI